MDRALIIAIENYDRAVSALTATKLPGTLAAAKAFRAWLEQKWVAEGVVGSIAFCSEPKEAGPGCRGAASGDIIDALIELEQQGRDQTENLYVYFSGHGFRVPGVMGTLDDVIVAADFIDLKRSATRACFKLGALIEGLRGSLGFGFHYYFIDACRNDIEKAIASDVMRFDMQGGGDPTVCMLQSAVPGAPALVAGPFAAMLVSGLKGAGQAKVWVPPATDSMKVRFDSLRTYLTKGLEASQAISAHETGPGLHDAILATIKPVPSIALTITVRTTLASINGTATVTPFMGAPASHPITAATTVIPLPPYTYTVALAIPNADVTPPANCTVELYEDGEIIFDAAEAGAARGPDLLLDPMRIEVPPNAEVVLRRIGTEAEDVFIQTTLADLPAGTYESTLRDHAGQVLLRRDVDLRPGQTIAPASWHGSLPHETIAGVLPVADGGVDFSESLGGAIVDPDLSLWLALVGAGRILGSTGEYRKIGRLPLADFSTEPMGASPVYVLAGLSDRAMPLRVALDKPGTRRRWLAPKEPAQMPGVRHLVFRPSPGQCFVTFRLADQPGYTLASFAMPNRGTLIVFTVDDDGQPHVAQYLLPIRHLETYLDPQVRAHLEQRRVNHTPLQDVQLLTRLYRAFHRRQRIAAEFLSSDLDELLYTKCLDPLGAALAAYELIRRGEREQLTVASSNMQRFFPDLPDMTAIRGLVHQTAEAPRGVPLFLDGLRAFADRSWLPFHAGLIDYAGPWTAWRGAVPGARRIGGGGA